MTFFKTLNYDIRRGIVRFIPWYLYAVILTFINSASFYNSIFADMKLSGQYITFGDLFFNLFAGMLAPDVFQNEVPVPIGLITLVLPFFFIILYYPFKDLNGFGSQLLCRSKSRKIWVTSKIIYTALSCLLFFGVVFFSLFIFSLIKKVVFTMGVNELTLNIFNVYSEKLPPNGYPLTIEFNFIFVIFMSFLALSLFQLLFSMAADILLSYIFTSASIILAAFVNSQFLPGNYMMLLRYGSVIGNTMQKLVGTCLYVNRGILILFAFIAAEVFFLYYVFCKRYDILNR